jgi:hypothetical protein
MPRWPAQPVIYEINTAAWLHDLGIRYGRRMTLGAVPDEEIARLAALAFDGIWLMGVWERSAASRQVARTHAGLLEEYRKALPDFDLEDVIGSPYAVRRYAVDPLFGGDAELDGLRRRMGGFGLRLILDFVPNHFARDHAWTVEHPEYLVEGAAANLNASPETHFACGARVFAHGRDPYFAPWTDTVQIDYRSSGARDAMRGLLLEIAARCDGLRCDMAMLVTAPVFSRTWGGSFDAREEFWPRAIGTIKAAHPDFLMMAEVYWDLESELQAQGFDYAYDKRLYDRLRWSGAAEVREHLRADIPYQRKLARFLENHDEDRAAVAFGRERSMAAAAAGLTLPGLRLIHEGQMEGYTRRVPVQLRRRFPEFVDRALAAFYRRLLEILRTDVMRDGMWTLCECGEAAPGNSTHRTVIAHLWTNGGSGIFAAANLSEQPSQSNVPLRLPEGANVLDMFTGERRARGPGAHVFLDLPPNGYQVFAIDGL